MSFVCCDDGLSNTVQSVHLLTSGFDQEVHLWSISGERIGTFATSGAYLDTLLSDCLVNVVVWNVYDRSTWLRQPSDGTDGQLSYTSSNISAKSARPRSALLKRQMSNNVTSETSTAASIPDDPTRAERLSEYMEAIQARHAKGKPSVTAQHDEEFMASMVTDDILCCAV